MNTPPDRQPIEPRTPGAVIRFYAGVAALVLLVLIGAVMLWQRVRPAPIVAGWTPPDGAASVSVRAAIRIAFSEPMDQNEVTTRFHLDPPLQGSATWQDDTFVYRPSRTLTPTKTYTVTLRAGAHTLRGRQLTRDLTWHFVAGAPRLTYLALDQAARLQVYAGGDPPVQLTDTEADVYEYAVHPEGDSIVYSILDIEGNADLWQIDRDGGNPHILLACAPDACTAPAWSADGSQIAYERQDTSEHTIGIGTGPLVPLIWLLDPRTGDTAPLVLAKGAEGLHTDAPTPGRGPVWSPAGQRLAFYDLSESAIQIVDLETGQRQFFDTLSGVGTWDPRGEQMILPDMTFHNNDSAGTLMRIDVTNRSVDTLDTPSTADGTMPRWSPTGEWIAFGRRSLADGRPTPGAQLWLMRPDGSEARPLVTDAAANLGAYTWRPDGEAIAYIRVEIADLSDPHPMLWVVSLDDGQTQQIAAEAVMPDWLP